MSARIHLFLIIFSCYAIILIICDNFCSENTFISNETRLHMSKELGNVEYGILGSSKELHCCAANYESIIWFKGNVMYPWIEEDSDFVLDAVSRNQTIFVNELSFDHQGEYSCLVVNGTSNFTKKFSLNVFVLYTGIPKFTYTPPKLLPMKVNQTVRLYCEAFVGRIDLPDAHSEILWQKVCANNTLVPIPQDMRTYTIPVERDNKLTLGEYLIIEDVQSSDFGNYLCSVSNAADQINKMYTNIFIYDDSNRISWTKQWLLPFFEIVIVILVIIGCYLCYENYKYDIKLFIEFFKIDEDDHTKEYDVVVLYELNQSSLAIDVIMPTLINEFDYFVASQLLEKDAALNSDCLMKITSSKRVLVVLSHTDSNTLQFNQHILQIGYAALNLHAKVICLLAQPNSVGAKEYKLGVVPRFVTVIEWPTNSKDWIKKWKMLRLYLPIKRRMLNLIKGKHYSTVNDRHMVCSA